MLIGETIRVAGSSTTVLHTMAFPRQGNAMSSVLEVFRMPADTELAIQPQHVNSEDMELTTSDGWDDVGDEITLGGGSTTIDEATVATGEASGLRELIRYKITLTAETSSSSFSHFRILAPSWQTSGAQSI